MPDALENPVRWKGGPERADDPSSSSKSAVWLKAAVACVGPEGGWWQPRARTSLQKPEAQDAAQEVHAAAAEQGHRGREAVQLEALVEVAAAVGQVRVAGAPLRRRHLEGQQRDEYLRRAVRASLTHDKAPQALPGHEPRSKRTAQGHHETPLQVSRNKLQVLTPSWNARQLK
jgi:hypothetical protein